MPTVPPLLWSGKPEGGDASLLNAFTACTGDAEADGGENAVIRSISAMKMKEQIFSHGYAGMG
jgi:hypothetical protein